MRILWQAPRLTGIVADLAVIDGLGLAEDGSPLVATADQLVAKIVPSIPVDIQWASRLSQFFKQRPDENSFAVVDADADIAAIWDLKSPDVGTGTDDDAL